MVISRARYTAHADKMQGIGNDSVDYPSHEQFDYEQTGTLRKIGGKA